MSSLFQKIRQYCAQLLEPTHNLFVRLKKMRFCNERLLGGRLDTRVSGSPKEGLHCKISLFGATRKIVGRLLDQLIPPRENERIVANITLEALQKDTAHYNRHTSSRQSATGTHILLPYREPRVEALVQELKYHRNPRALSLAAHLIADEILGITSEELSPPLLVPIPMHAARRAKRGHNQTELLCKEVAHILGDSVRYESHALERTRLTPPQQTLPRTARLTNVKNSIRATPTLVRTRTIIVLDDVTTTGATLQEAKRALTKAGAGRAYCIALAG